VATFVAPWPPGYPGQDDTCGMLATEEAGMQPSDGPGPIVRDEILPARGHAYNPTRLRVLVFGSSVG
jgi:hypothetical protein